MHLRMHFGPHRHRHLHFECAARGKVLARNFGFVIHATQLESKTIQ